MLTYGFCAILPRITSCFHVPFGSCMHDAAAGAASPSWDVYAFHTFSAWLAPGLLPVPSASMGNSAGSRGLGGDTSAQARGSLRVWEPVLGILLLLLGSHLYLPHHASLQCAD